MLCCIARSPSACKARNIPAGVNILERRLGVISAAQQNFRSEVGQIKGQLGGSEGAIAGWVGDLRDEIREQQVVAAVREEELRRDIRVLSDSMVKLRSEFGSSVDHWRLQEVEQLMVIANQRLQLSADTEMAGKALKLADNQLRRLADPAFRPVRAILADEIAALGKVSTVDVAGHAERAFSSCARGGRSAADWRDTRRWYRFRGVGKPAGGRSG